MGMNMREKKGLNIIIEEIMPGLSRLLHVLAISLLFVQFLWTPALAQKVEYYNGYNLIYYDDGSKEIINGDFNFLRWDGVWRPNSELNISNGSWPYLYSGNATNANFKVNDTTLSIPKANTQFKLKKNSISYNLVYSKAELLSKETSINLTDAFLDFPYDLKSKKPKNEYKDQFNIRYDRFHFKAGMEHIVIHDDTPVDYIEGGTVYQDVTYLFPGDYDFKIDNNGQIRLKFKKDSLKKLKGNVIIEIRTWDVVGANNSIWGQNVSFNSTTEVRATGNVELKQTIDDYSLYTRFDEGNGLVIHNENTSNVLEGYLEGDIGNNSTSGRFVQGRYGQAFYFNGINNKVLFNDHPAIRLPFDFSISFYIKLAPGVNNSDTDIMRKGSTATAIPNHWWKVEIKSNKTQGVVYKENPPEIGEKDTLDRRDGNWHFVAYTREGTTCTLIVDGSGVANRTNCPTNATNSALLAIGAKDTYNQTTGLDFTNGTIDEVRMFNRNLTSLELASIRNNTHFPSGSITRNLTSVILAGEELKEVGCNGTWDGSITKVDIMASTNNITWDTIQSNATKNVLYNVSHNKNYKYTRCSLSTTNASQTPIIESIRARISISTIPPQPWNLQYTLGNYWINHTWQAGTGIVTDAYNISVNGVWHNGTNSYYNDSTGASNWSNITVWAWNNSGSGNMSALSVSQNIQAPLIPLRINITSYAPLSPSYDNVGAIRTFNLTVNETVNLTWYINGTQVSSNSSVTAGNYTNTSAKSGTWNVSAVANNSNGSVTKTWIWTVSDLIANAGGPYTGTPGILINFTGSASGGIAPYLYHWNFGDGQTSSLANPSHAYASKGSYIANLTVTDSAGRTSSPDTAPVSVEWVRFINGTIMDSINKAGLAGVKVSTNTSLSTMTNATGFYSFEVTSGDYNITATFEPIYYPNSTAVSLMGAVAVQDIELLKKPTGNITGQITGGFL